MQHMFCRNCGKELNESAVFCNNCGTKITRFTSVEDIIVQYRGIWDGETTSNDCFVAPYIPEETKNKLRCNFGVNFEEYLLFARDTSLWDSKNQGLVITDKYIRCIPDSDKADGVISLAWSLIIYTQFRDNSIYFFGKNNNPILIHISYFIKNSDDDDNCKRIGYNLVLLFNLIAQSVEPEVDPMAKIIEECDVALNNQDYESVLKLALPVKSMASGGVLYYYISKAYLQQEEYNKCINSCNDGLSKSEETTPLFAVLCYNRALGYYNIGNIAYARKDLLAAKLNAPDDFYLDSSLLKDIAFKDFEICEKDYTDKFLEYPYAERKLLLCVSQYVNLYQKNLAVIDINKLPVINFPLGHPVANQLYVGHPLLADKYIPFDNYEIELLEDKIREFCQIMQCLGAKKITIDSINSSNSERDSNYCHNISGGASYRLASTEGLCRTKESQHLIEQISQSISLHQKFKSIYKELDINQLIWYPNEPSWQRIYEQRKQGALLHHEERIEVRKSRVIEGGQLKEVGLELKNLLFDLTGHWDNYHEEKFTLQENAILSINVEFATEEELKNAGNKSMLYTHEEQEYLNEVKCCFQVDNKITPSERRLLEKLRVHLGLSESKVHELEHTLTRAVLTGEEREYYDEYQLCLNDGNIITESERRLLNKLSKRLNISEERVIEIEKSRY